MLQPILLKLFIAVGVLMTFYASTAQAEYRAYQLEIFDLQSCSAANNTVDCPSYQVFSGMTPQLYQANHGGDYMISVILLATWMCYGDTSNFEPVCDRPEPVEPLFGAGEPVIIKLKKHITEGWQGVVELAYYQRSVQSNIYGVRFPDRGNIYMRYFQKDIEATFTASEVEPR